MTSYVLGFAFSLDRKWVALIQKERPAWQAGKYNGIGGHTESGDITGAAAQAREFKEETGVDIPASQWDKYAVLVGPDYMVRVFRAFTDDVFKCTSTTDEMVACFQLSELATRPHMQNLEYLIPLALDTAQDGYPIFHYGPPA